MNEKEKLTHYYRWQFLRLNKDYQKVSDLYAKVVDATKKNRRWSEAKKQNVISGLETKLFEQYGINGIYSHKIKKPPAKLRIYGFADFAIQKGTLKEVFGNKLTENQEIRGNHLLETIPRVRMVKKGKKKLKSNVPVITARYVQVVVNFDAEMAEIQSAINRIVKSARVVRREVGIKRAKTRSQETSKDYDNYLKVWKLNKEGRRNIEIAEEIFPAHNGHSREDKANKYLNRAKALIDGDYRKIKF